MKRKWEKYQNMTDEAIISEISLGDDSAIDFLIDRYKGVVRTKARAYFLIGADREDVVQEGMIGLYKAIRDFKPSVSPSFRTFAELCVTRQIITAVKSATRKKHNPLNSYVSLDKSYSWEENGGEFIDAIEKMAVPNPEEIFLGNETKNYIEKHIADALSPFETRTLYFFMQGLSYFQVAEICGKDAKAIDNAIQRIRKKVVRIIDGDAVKEKSI